MVLGGFISSRWIFFARSDHLLRFQSELFLACLDSKRYESEKKKIDFCVHLQDRSSFMLKLEDTENWLYEDGEDCQKQVYVDKLAELKVSDFNNILNLQ